MIPRPPAFKSNLNGLPAGAGVRGYGAPGANLLTPASVIFAPLWVALAFIALSVVHADEPKPDSGKQIVQSGGGKYQITIDTSETPDLKDWATANLAPVVKEW